MVYGHADVLRVLSLMSDRKMFVRSAVTHLRRQASKCHRQHQQHDGGTTAAVAVVRTSKKRTVTLTYRAYFDKKCPDFNCAHCWPEPLLTIIENFA